MRACNVSYGQKASPWRWLFSWHKGRGSYKRAVFTANDFYWMPRASASVVGWAVDKGADLMNYF